MSHLLQNVVDVDEREARLPAWARAKLNGLRRAVHEARAGEHEARLATDPDESTAILRPYDEVPVGLGDERVRFKLPGYANSGPGWSKYVDVRVRGVGTDLPGWLELGGGGSLVLRPYVTNRLFVSVES